MAIIRSKQFEKIFEGNIEVTGSISVLGSAIFIQTSSFEPAITISGSAVIGKSEVTPTTFSGSLSIEGLGVLSVTSSNQTLDLGNESF